MMLSCDKLWTHPASNRVECELVFWTQLESYLGSVWFVCLKTENCCLKTFVEIRVGEKVC